MEISYVNKKRITFPANNIFLEISLVDLAKDTGLFALARSLASHPAAFVYSSGVYICKSIVNDLRHGNYICKSEVIYLTYEYRIEIQVEFTYVNQ